MEELGFEFMKGAVGPDGAKALQKAMERAPALSTALVPRVIVSWLTAHRDGYEGELPGLAGSHMTLVKNESSYSGVVSVGDTLHAFYGEPFVKVAAGLAVVLGVDTALERKVRPADLSNLGKSIDALVFAQWGSPLAKTASTGVAPPGQAAQPRGPKAPVPPPTPTKQRAMPKLPAVESQSFTRKAELSMTKEEMDATCPHCHKREFEGKRFVGCDCLKGLAKGGDFILSEKDGRFTFRFGRSWTHTDISKLIMTIKGVTSGG